MTDTPPESKDAPTEQFVPANAHHVRTVDHTGILFTLCHVPGESDGKGVLYTAGMDGAVYALDLDATEAKLERRWKNHDNYVTCAEIVAGTMITGGVDRQLIWTDIETGEEILRVSAHDGWIRNIVAFPNGEQIASCGDDMLVHVWDVATGKRLLTLDEHEKLTPQGFATALYALAVSPDGRWLASGDRVGEIRVWDLEQAPRVTKISAPDFYTYDPVKRSRSIGGIRCLCFSPDSKQLAVAGIGAVTNVDGFVGPCRIELWDFHTPERTYFGQSDHKAILNHIRYHPTEPFLLSVGGGDGGGILAVWDFKQEKPVHKVGVKGHLQRFCWRNEGLEISAAGYHGIQDWAFTTPPPKETNEKKS